MLDVGGEDSLIRFQYTETALRTLALAILGEPYKDRSGFRPRKMCARYST